MIDEIAKAGQRSAANTDDLGNRVLSASKSIPPEITVRKEWLPAETVLSLEPILVVAIVVLSIGQAVWAFA